MFAVSGRNTALAATGDTAANLWNPAGGEAITVYRVEARNLTTSTMRTQMSRVSTIGTTPSATITPDIDNHFLRKDAPSSAPVLTLGNFATEPVFIGGTDSCAVTWRGRWAAQASLTSP